MEVSACVASAFSCYDILNCIAHQETAPGSVHQGSEIVRWMGRQERDHGRSRQPQGSAPGSDYPKRSPATWQQGIDKNGHIYAFLTMTAIE